MKPLLLGAGLAIALGSASLAELAAPQTMKIEAQELSAATKKSTAARQRAASPVKSLAPSPAVMKFRPAANLKWVTTGTESPPASILWSAGPIVAAAAKSGMNIERLQVKVG